MNCRCYIGWWYEIVEEYRMVFVTVDEDRLQLENLTELLVRTFPGSVIYQYTDPVYALINTENREIDVVFANVSVSRRNDWQLLSLLRRRRPDLRVFVLSDDEQLRDAAMERGAWGYLTRPVTGQRLRDAIEQRKAQCRAQILLPSRA